MCDMTELLKALPQFDFFAQLILDTFRRVLRYGWINGVQDVARKPACVKFERLGLEAVFKTSCTVPIHPICLTLLLCIASHSSSSPLRWFT